MNGRSGTGGRPLGGPGFGAQPEWSAARDHMARSWSCSARNCLGTSGFTKAGNDPLTASARVTPRIVSFCEAAPRVKHPFSFFSSFPLRFLCFGQGQGWSHEAGSCQPRFEAPCAWCAVRSRLPGGYRRRRLGLDAPCTTREPASECCELWLPRGPIILLFALLGRQVGPACASGGSKLGDRVDARHLRPG